MIFIINFSYANAELISYQIKDTLKLWSANNVTDSVFITSIQDMGKNGLIKLKHTYETYSLPEKGQTLLVKISGRISDYQKRVPVSLTITDPKGVESKITAQLLDTGIYQTSIILSHKSDIGLYKIQGNYLGRNLEPNYFVVSESSKIIPKWISNVITWWNNGIISDIEFISTIQYLIDTDIIQIPTNNESSMNVYVKGENAVRRGTMQEITVLVNDRQKPIEGAHVFLRIEDYGENILKEFDGFTDNKGQYLISWEIQKNAKQETLLVFIDVTDGIHTQSKVFSFDVWCLCGEPNCKCRN